MSTDSVHFHWLDYAVLVGLLAFSSLIGFIVGWRERKSTSAKNFLTGKGEIHWILISFSMQASFFSAIFLLSTPGEIYAYGTCYCYIGLSFVLGQLIGTHLFIPIFYRLNVLNVYEYLERRFSKILQTCGSIIFTLQTLLYLPLVLYSPALALAQVTGLSILWSILFCGLVCTLYTCLGGMKATVWNDFFQMMIIFVGLGTVIGIGVAKIGGFGALYRRNLEGGRFVNEFRIDLTLRTTFWTQLFGGMVFSIKNYASNQVIIQKCFGAKTLKETYKALYSNVVGNVFILLLISLIGLLAFAFYYDCDPLTSGRVKKLDQVVPLMVVEILKGYYGLSGLFIATAFSAALSSMSGCLNSLAAILLTGFIEPTIKQTSFVLGDKPRVLLTRFLVLLCGLYTTITAYYSHFLGESAMQLSYSASGVTGGPLLSLIVLGMLFPFVNVTGCIVGLVSGTAVGFWVAIGALVSKISHPMLPFQTYGCLNGNFSLNDSCTSKYNHTFSIENNATTDASTLEMITYVTQENSTDIPWIYRLSFFYYSVLGFTVTLLVAIVVSLLTGGNKHVDPSLLFKCLRKGAKSELNEQLHQKLEKLKQSKALLEVEKEGKLEITMKVEDVTANPIVDIVYC